MAPFRVKVCKFSGENSIGKMDGNGSKSSLLNFVIQENLFSDIIPLIIMVQWKIGVSPILPSGKLT